MSWSHETQERNKRLRAQRLAAGRLLGRHTQEEWELMLDACDYLCVRCWTDEPLVRDHILPLCLGGSDHIENIQPLCWSCNSAKGARDTRDYRPKRWREVVLGVYRDEDYPAAEELPGEDDEDADWVPKMQPDVDEHTRAMLAPLVARIRV